MVEVLFPVLAFSWLLIYLSSFWIFMKKSGYPGWYAFVPFYNLYILTKIAGRSGWWTLAFFVPILNLAAQLMIWTDIGERYNKSTGFSVGLAWMNAIFLPILALSDAKIEDRRSSGSRFRSDLRTDSEFRTFTNKDGDTVEEIPLEDWE